MIANADQEQDVAEQLCHQYFCLTQIKQAIKALEHVVRLREQRIARRRADADRFQTSSRSRLPEERTHKRTWQFARMAGGAAVSFGPVRRTSVN
jgi:hypothetical protein